MDEETDTHACKAGMTADLAHMRSSVESSLYRDR
jgi:hypothetical protein